MWIVATFVLLGAAAVLAVCCAALRRHVRELETPPTKPARRSGDFLICSLSHELRTPLTAMIGYAEVAQQPSLEADRRNECLARMMDSGRRLVRLVNDVFDHAKLNEAQLALHPVDCRLDDVLDEAAAPVRPEADRKGLLLALRVEDDVPQHVRADPTRVAQVLRLALDNAVKFTRRGHVGIRVELQNRRLLFRVHDTGPGVGSDVRSGLFEAGQAGDQTDSRRHGGIGLGLGLAQKLAALMEGTLSHEASKEGGSVFTLELPFVPAAGTPEPARAASVAAEPKPDPDRPQFSGRVLVVEDSQDNQLLVRHALRRFGVDSEVAENGRIALRALQQRSFDLVLMDMQMPVLDGYATTRQIREGGSSVPIVALTAHGMSGERERCLEIGCDEFLTKPLERSQLARVLSRFLPKSPADPAHAD